MAHQQCLHASLQDDRMTCSPRNECHMSVAATAAPHARAYELALDEGQMEQEEEFCGVSKRS